MPAFSARRKPCASDVFDMTWDTGMPASSIACKLVPDPDINTTVDMQIFI